jgi:UDPglucose 6-dehydrogenase
MTIGFIGLGKLGLPCALAINARGHEVLGIDKDPLVRQHLERREIPYREEGAAGLLAGHTIEWAGLGEIVSRCQIIFVAIQTPHGPRFEGSTRLPADRADFDYTHLVAGVRELSDEVERQGVRRTVVVISTVLPGTLRREVVPLLGRGTALCYNPFFIAMGTTIRDFTSPEFVLLGVGDPAAAAEVRAFYATIHGRLVYECSIEEAEMIKVSYNTFITMKVCLANTIMEMSHRIGGIDCDRVMDGLFMAGERLISTRYLRGGMGDGGGCHPRDNIALSWLARELGASFDWYESLMLCRERQTEWMADLVEENMGGLPVVILGKSFKRGTNLTAGSPAMLLSSILSERGVPHDMHDPHVDTAPAPRGPALYFLATNHDEFLEWDFPAGSVVVDPWRYLPGVGEGVRLVWVGKNNMR